MKKGALFVILGYGAWVAVNILITVLKIGDAGANAHLALLFTGLPISLVSLSLPHGTLIAVLVAGFLGLVQWVLVIRFAGRKRNASNA